LEIFGGLRADIRLSKVTLDFKHKNPTFTNLLSAITLIIFSAIRRIQILVRVLELRVFLQMHLNDSTRKDLVD